MVAATASNADPNGDPTRTDAAVTDVEGEIKKLPYPKSVAFIISNEFCERFCYYGLRTILVLYLTRKLAYDDDTATIVYHTFSTLVYFMCTFGAILSDSWLGKFNTILYLSIVYAIGSTVVSLGAIPPLGLPAEAMTLLGLALIALGSGGIKPCVAAFGGDQFKMPEQAKQMQSYFSLFYFAINSGSLISTSITPILRQDVNCFGDDGCYSLAFGVPGALMILSIFIFVFGKFMYKITPPAGNMVVLVSKCIANAIATRWRESKFNKRSHWLEYAEPIYGKQLVYDTRILLNVLVLFLPLPVFWSLFDQQGSRWTFQATRMDGDIGFYEVKPDQMQVVNPALILLFIPLYDVVFYPLLDKIGIRRPLQKLTLGGIFAGIAFVCSGIVELQLEQTYPVLPNAGSAHFRIYNTMPCNYTATTSLRNHTRFELPALGVYKVEADQVGTFSYNLQPIVGSNCPALQGTFHLKEAESSSYYINTAAPTDTIPATLTQFWDDPAKSRSGFPALRVIANLPTSAKIRIVDKSSEQNPQRYLEQAGNTTRVELVSSELEVYVNGVLVTKIHLRLGAVAALIVSPATHGNGTFQTSVVHITEANSFNMMWLLPQYIIMTLGEVMFSVTGLAFSYAQAPLSMKSVLQACWLLTVAFGNVIDVIIVGARIFESQANEFFLFAGLMFIDMLIFMWLAYRYTALEVKQFEPDVTDELISGDADSGAGPKKLLTGLDNAAFIAEKPATSG